jgi:hypothetical protein
MQILLSKPYYTDMSVVVAPSAQVTSAESSTTKCMIANNCTVGLTEPLAVFIYQ